MEKSESGGANSGITTTSKQVALEGKSKVIKFVANL
jgi:hypothetical protein